MTPVFCCGFECGVTASHWTLTGATFTTSSPLSGLRSLLCNPVAADHYAVLPAFATSGMFVFRFKIRYTTLPSADTRLCVVDDAGDFGGGVTFKQSDGKLYAASNAAMGATGVSIVTGQTYYIDCRVNRTANPWLIDAQVNGVACGQLSEAHAINTSANQFYIGSPSGGGDYNVLFDDFILSATTGDYPIGAGKVLSFVPNADGTHTFTSTHAILGTTGAPTTGSNITSATTTAFGFVNARPIGGGVADATRLWNQATAASAEYAEVLFEDTVEVNAPRAVEALIIRRDTTTAVGDSTFKLNDNGTESTIFATGAVAGIASDDFHTKQFATAPSTGAAWTLALFNGLRFRFGYSADATPDHYCRGVMIEAEFPESLGPEAFDRPMGQQGGNQMHQLLAQ